MSLSFLFQCACLVSLFVPLTQVRAQQRVFDVTKYGARADGTTDSSKALIYTWNEACRLNGGGVVLFPKGTYVVAPVVLLGPCKGQMNLQILGTLRASRDVKDFINVDHWITIQRVERLRIGGGGTLDGLGADGWDYNDCQQNPGHCKQLPATLRLDFVTNAVIHRISSINSKNTHINLFACNDLRIRRVKISAPENSPNTDGIHIGASQNIQIMNSYISTGDDCISVLPGSKNINVTGVQCGPGHGISVGSLGRGDGDSVTDLYVSHCKFVSTDNGVRIKTWAVNSKPGNVSRVSFEHIEMVNVANPIIIDQEYCPGGGCSTQESSKVQISDIKFNDIRGISTTKNAVTLKCSRSEPCRDVELRDIDLTYQGPGGPAVSLCENVKGRAYGIEKPPLHISTPRVATYHEVDDVEGRNYFLPNPTFHRIPSQVAAYGDIEDVESRAYGLQNPPLHRTSPELTAYHNDVEDVEDRTFGIQNPSLDPQE